MKRQYAILTIATGLFLAGCESDNSSDTRWNPQQKESYNLSSVQSIDKKNVMLSEGDRRFLADALAGGMYEMQEGQYIVLYSGDTDVKSLAQHLVDDHTKANLQIKSLTETKGVRIEPSLTTDQIDKIAALKKLSGPELDKEYLRQQQAAHQTTIKMFELASSSADDSSVRDLASQMLPTLREHLDRVNTQATAKGVPVSTETPAANINGQTGK